MTINKRRDLIKLYIFRCNVSGVRTYINYVEQHLRLFNFEG